MKKGTTTTAKPLAKSTTSTTTPVKDAVGGVTKLRQIIQNSSKAATSTQTTQGGPNRKFLDRIHYLNSLSKAAIDGWILDFKPAEKKAGSGSSETAMEGRFKLLASKDDSFTPKIWTPPFTVQSGANLFGLGRLNPKDTTKNWAKAKFSNIIVEGAPEEAIQKDPKIIEKQQDFINKLHYGVDRVLELMLDQKGVQTAVKNKLWNEANIEAQNRLCMENGAPDWKTLLARLKDDPEKKKEVDANFKQYKRDIGFKKWKDGASNVPFWIPKDKDEKEANVDTGLEDSLDDKQEEGANDNNTSQHKGSKKWDGVTRIVLSRYVWADPEQLVKSGLDGKIGPTDNFDPETSMKSATNTQKEIMLDLESRSFIYRRMIIHDHAGRRVELPDDRFEIMINPGSLVNEVFSFEPYSQESHYGVRLSLSDNIYVIRQGVATNSYDNLTEESAAAEEFVRPSEIKSAAVAEHHHDSDIPDHDMTDGGSISDGYHSETGATTTDTGAAPAPSVAGVPATFGRQQQQSDDQKQQPDADKQPEKKRKVIHKPPVAKKSKATHHDDDDIPFD
jgi:hypothetical protein